MHAKIKDKIDIQTDRLTLRNIRISDIDQLLKYAGENCITDMMNGSIPHNYTKEIATQWILKHAEDSSQSSTISWAIALKDSNECIGSIQLRLAALRQDARSSYWIAKPYWNRGIATEAGVAVIQYAFTRLQLERIEAEHFRRNSASGVVLRKLGFQYIGSISKPEGLFGRLEDFERYYK